MSLSQTSTRPLPPHRLPWRRLGLRGKLVLLVLLIAVPLLALELAGIYQNFESRTQQELQASRELAQASGAAFLNYLQNLWNSELAMGTAITTHNLPQEAVEAYLHNQLASHPTVDSLAWVSPRGIVLLSTTPSSQGLDCSNREHVRQVISGRDQALSGVVKSRATGRLVFFVARGIRRDGHLLGMMVASVQVSNLGTVLPKRGGRRNMALSDSTGAVVYRSNDQSDVKTIRVSPPGAPVWRVMHTGQPVEIDNYPSPMDGSIRRTGVFLPLPGIGWVVGATSRTNEFLAGARAAAARDLAVLLAVTVISLLGALLLGETFLRPILSLEQAARAISEGDLKARVSPAGEDELATAGHAFNRMADRIQELESERTRFLEIAAHALRNPMTSAKGACSLLRLRLLKGETLGEEAADDLRIMEKEIDRLSGQLDEVLDAFCLREGQLSVWREPVDLSEAIGEVLESHTILDKSHRYTFEQDGTARVYGDSRRLEEVFRNLIGNAAKYSPKGGEIRTVLTVHDKTAVVAIHDEGLGIPKDEVERVFQPFYRASNLADRDPGGIGLGLYISRQIVHDHGGRIWVESEEGKGTTFYVELPRLSTM